MKQVKSFRGLLAYNFVLCKFECTTANIPQTRWPGGLSRGSEADRLLGFRVRIPPISWMSVSCYVLCAVRWISLRWADHSSSGVEPSLVWPSVMVKSQYGGDLGPLRAVETWWGGGEHSITKESLCTTQAV